MKDVYGNMNENVSCLFLFGCTLRKYIILCGWLMGTNGAPGVPLILLSPSTIATAYYFCRIYSN